MLHGARDSARWTSAGVRTTCVAGRHAFTAASTSAPAEPGRDVGENVLDEMSIVFDAELVGYGQQ